MAKNYDITETENKKIEVNKVVDTDQIARHKLLQLIMSKIDNGSNIDYIVKLSEVYRNIK